jgi:uncharacterized protein YfiM (DUF2279 family)
MIADRPPPSRESTPGRGVKGAALALALLLPAAPAAARDAWLGKDKALHVGATFALASAAYAAAAPLRAVPVVRLGTAATLAMTAGIAKEMRDRATHGDASLRDLTWDAAGTATGLLVAWLIDRYLLSPRHR